MRTDSERRWYLTALCSVYLVLCSIACLHYLWLDTKPNAEIVPLLQQVLCLAFALASGAYFYRANAGRIALTFLTVLTLIAIGRSQPQATAFHLCALLVLVLPLLRKHKSLTKNRFGADLAGAPLPHA